VLEEVPAGVCPSSRLAPESATPGAEARSCTLSTLIKSAGTTTQTMPITILGNFMADSITCDALAVPRFVSLPEYSPALRPGNGVREFVRFDTVPMVERTAGPSESGLKSKRLLKSRSLVKFNKTIGNSLV
jgi:hypothetical protein